MFLHTCQEGASQESMKGHGAFSEFPPCNKLFNTHARMEEREQEGAFQGYTKGHGAIFKGTTSLEILQQLSLWI